ncbi:glycerophosphodiester phosphodiesterase [Pedobacter sp. BAL39]|uniref:glycerophosphodiester phosphodiesterase family protein n=1 Tax=Pedobacter sp. BAL39 TaxID=391596 RepID=UPI0001559E96|nr:glycerophosphodiester phosphodiesterase family protein [Pedobacter sp. BAL39]EDM38731.1 glycerophosphodiester phosphodiesterase [Pedobacter sp. BAL39]
MNQLKWLLIGFTFFFVSCSNEELHCLVLEDTTALRQLLNPKEGGYPLLSAHRGGPMKGYPENCIATFENATRYQPVIIEFDVALSKDSILVAMHDDLLDRTTNGRGPVGAKMYSQLQQLRLKDGEGKLTSFEIPTLNEVLLWGKNKVLFTIDIKKGVPFDRVIDCIRDTKAEANSIVITYNATQAAEVHRLAPDLMISASVGSMEDLVRLNTMGVPNKRIVAFVGISEPGKALFDQLHQLGIICILGTMGNLDKRAAANPDKNIYYNLFAGGADVLSTDRIPEAGIELDRYRNDKNLSSAYLKKK